MKKSIVRPTSAASTASASPGFWKLTIYISSPNRRRMISMGSAGGRGMNGRVEADHPRHALRMAKRHLPNDDATPVMTAEHRSFDAQMIQQTHQIAGQMLHVVGFHGAGSRGQPITALIGRDGPTPRRFASAQLMAPGERKLGKAVAEDHRHAASRASLVVSHAQAVGVCIGDRRHLALEGGHPSISGAEGSFGDSDREPGSRQGTERRFGRFEHIRNT